MSHALAKQESQAVVPADSGSILQVVSRLAADPDANPERLEKYLDMYERLQSKQAETDFNAALTAAQSEIGRVAADATNSQTRSKYATYAALDRALRPIYTAHGFALSFDEADPPRDDWIRVLCHVSHRGGHTRTYKKDMPADGKGAKGGDVMTKTHAAGSAMSYGMRYLLKGIFNVAIGDDPDDDDGNAASEPVISGKQADDLAALISEVGADYKKFLRYYKVEAVGMLPASKYKDAVAALEKKRK